MRVDFFLLLTKRSRQGVNHSKQGVYYCCCELLLALA